MNVLFLAALTVFGACPPSSPPPTCLARLRVNKKLLNASPMLVTSRRQYNARSPARARTSCPTFQEAAPRREVFVEVAYFDGERFAENRYQDNGGAEEAL